MAEMVSNISSILVGTAAKQGPLPSGATLDTTAAGAATAGIFGAAGKVNYMELLSGGLSFASAASALFGANEQADAQLRQSQQEARALELQSREERIAAQQEEVRGKQESNDIMDQMLRTISAQQLASSSKGVDIGFGTPVSVTEETRKIGNLQQSTARDDATLRALARRRQASAYDEQRINTLTSGRATAANTRNQGRITALGIAADGIERRVRRG